jgi:hypothetical protein
MTFRTFHESSILSSTAFPQLNSSNDLPHLILAVHVALISYTLHVFEIRTARSAATMANSVAPRPSTPEVPRVPESLVISMFGTHARSVYVFLASQPLAKLVVLVKGDKRL